MMYDLVLRGGRVIDPSQNIDSVCDVAIKNGCIADIKPYIITDMGQTIKDVTDQLVVPGLIDSHGHVFQYVTGRFGLDADLVGVQSGVTTVIDQGGPSCMTLPAFRAHVVDQKQTRVLAFLSTYLVGGLEGHYYPSLYRPDCVDVDATVRAAKQNPDIVRGFKAHAEIGGFARWGLDVIKLAAEIGRQADLPLYIHFGQLWPLPAIGSNGVDPDTILADVVQELRAGDILSHPFSRHAGSFVNSQGQVHPIVKQALDKGLRIDVGYGSHFSFDSARRVLDAGIRPHTLGADMHGYNTRVPRPQGTPDSHPDTDHMFFGHVGFSLVSAMTAMLALGFSLSEVVAMATVNSANMAGLGPLIGTLRPGAPADISVLNLHHGSWTLTDNQRNQVKAEQQLEPAFCLRQGVEVQATASILPKGSTK
jgi:dihydroorotase